MPGLESSTSLTQPTSLPRRRPPSGASNSERPRRRQRLSPVSDEDEMDPQYAAFLQMISEDPSFFDGEGRSETNCDDQKKCDGDGDGQLNGCQDIEGSICPICFQAWTSSGDHCVCCLPCGHLYGMSCIKRWFQQCGRSQGKCPQCNRKCSLKGVRRLYTSSIIVVNDDLQKKLQCLEDRFALLEKKVVALQDLQNKFEALESKMEVMEEKISTLVTSSPVSHN